MYHDNLGTKILIKSLPQTLKVAASKGQLVRVCAFQNQGLSRSPRQIVKPRGCNTIQIIWINRLWISRLWIRARWRSKTFIVQFLSKWGWGWGVDLNSFVLSHKPHPWRNPRIHAKTIRCCNQATKRFQQDANVLYIKSLINLLHTKSYNNLLLSL